MRKIVITLAILISGVILISIGAAIGGSGKSSSGTAAPAPTVTRTKVISPGPNIPSPAVTVTQTVKPRVPRNSVMSGDGVYVVGSDIRHGVYHTTGALGGRQGNCYIALLGSTNTGDIIDNANVTGPDTITINSGVKAVETNGCKAWTRTGAQWLAISARNAGTVIPMKPNAHADTCRAVKMTTNTRK
jgi:hypothetical protein